MLKREIKVGGRYGARVSGKFVSVRVDAIRETFTSRASGATVYDVTNLSTGRKLTFRSAQKFRWEDSRLDIEVLEERLESANRMCDERTGLACYESYNAHRGAILRQIEAFRPLTALERMSAHGEKYSEALAAVAGK